MKSPLLKLVALAIFELALAKNIKETKPTMAVEYQEYDDDNVDYYKEEDVEVSNVRGEMCEFVNARGDRLYQREVNNSYIYGADATVEKVPEIKRLWKILQWVVDDLGYYEFQNLGSSEYLGVENFGTRKYDLFVILSRGMPYSNKHSSNLWKIELAPADTKLFYKNKDPYYLKHKETGLYLNLDEHEEGLAVLEEVPYDRWMIRCKKIILK